MTVVTRRQLLASGGAAVLASFALPKNLRTLLDPAPESPGDLRARAGSVSKIEHVVVLMQENRSFDHYFGTMPGVRGFGIEASAAVFISHVADHERLPAALPHRQLRLRRGALPSNSHSWAPQHASWDSGKMDGFVSAHLAADGESGLYTMAYFERQDVPFHWAVADAFTILDGYHCSMLGPTWPNRLFLMTGTVDPNGAAGGPVYSNYVPSEGFSWTTYPELLTKADISWKVYQEVDNYGMNVLEYFDQYQNASPSSPLYQNAMRFYQAGQFEYDALHDRLPTVSWIIPTSYQSEHPNFMPAAGADFIAAARRGRLQPVAVGEDGVRDHLRRERRPVRPRHPADRPAGTADEYITVDGAANPIGLGFRVPGLIVSPWTVGGYVSHSTFDHTSVIRLIESITCSKPEHQRLAAGHRRRPVERARRGTGLPGTPPAGHPGRAARGRAASTGVPTPAHT